VNHVPNRLANLRDVASASPNLQPGLLLRSDAPLRGDDESSYDVAWPPVTVVDLRDPDEPSQAHPLASVATVVTAPILDPDSRGTVDAETTLADLYRSWLSGASARNLAAAVTTVATALSEGNSPVLVHCTAGKDRTGVTIAVVLSLVGLEPAAILDDYVRTGPAVPGIWARTAATLPATSTLPVATAVQHALAGVDRQAVAGVLEHLNAHPGGVQKWLTDHGGAADAGIRLRSALLVGGGLPSTSAAGTRHRRRAAGRVEGGS